MGVQPVKLPPLCCLYTQEGAQKVQEKNVLFFWATVLGPGLLHITLNVLEHPAEEVLCMARV